MKQSPLASFVANATAYQPHSARHNHNHNHNNHNQQQQHLQQHQQRRRSAAMRQPVAAPSAPSASDGSNSDIQSSLLALNVHGDAPQAANDQWLAEFMMHHAHTAHPPHAKPRSSVPQPPSAPSLGPDGPHILAQASPQTRSHQQHQQHQQQPSSIVFSSGEASLDAAANMFWDSVSPPQPTYPQSQAWAWAAPHTAAHSDATSRHPHDVDKQIEESRRRLAQLLAHMSQPTSTTKPYQ